MYRTASDTRALQLQLSRIEIPCFSQVYDFEVRLQLCSAKKMVIYITILRFAKLGVEP